MKSTMETISEIAAEMLDNILELSETLHQEDRSSYMRSIKEGLYSRMQHEEDAAIKLLAFRRLAETVTKNLQMHRNTAPAKRNAFKHLNNIRAELFEWESVLDRSRLLDLIRQRGPSSRGPYKKREKQASVA